MRVFSASDVRAALPMPAAIAAMREAFAALARGEVTMPARSMLALGPGLGTFLVMPATLSGLVGAKLVTVRPDNPSAGRPAIHAQVLVFDVETGEPRAVMDGTVLTAIRTGAASGLATDILARPDARRAALIGAGAQARTQLEAVRCVRDIRRVAVWSRTPERAAALAAELGAPDDGLEAVAAASPSAAARDAEVICTATPATEPLLHAADVPAGAHLNAVGSFTPAMRELAGDLLARARVVVDQREAALAEAGEVIAAVRSGQISPSALVELGEIVAGRAAGRARPDQVTVFKSVGLAVQDLAAASRVLMAAARH